MSLGVAELRLCSADETCGAVKKLSQRTFPLCLHRHDGTQIWHLGPISAAPWAEMQIKQLAQAAANSPDTWWAKPDQRASVSGIKVLLLPWGTAFPNKQNVNSIWIFLIPGSKNLLVTYVSLQILAQDFPEPLCFLCIVMGFWQHCTNK